MRDEVVRRRRWLDDQRFMDLLAMTNLIPGPNSTEMAIHLGYLRAGWPGIMAAGLLFIIPAALSVGGMAWLYVRYGSLPQVEWLLYGVKPVVVAVVVQAILGLGPAALRLGTATFRLGEVRVPLPSPLLATVGGGSLGLYLAGVDETALLFGGGLVVLVVKGAMRRAGSMQALALMPSLGVGSVLPTFIGSVSAAAVPYSPSVLFLTFLKIGAVLYGSGYVLLAFLRAEFVQRLGWLTDQQVIDAVAVGQFTPGPVFTTATFVGYLVGGAEAAGLATIGIFLPSFVFVALSHPLVPKIRNSQWLSPLMDGVNASALGLMAAVTLELGQAALVDSFTVLLLVLAMVALRSPINSAWLVLAGGVAGVAARVVGG